MSLAVPSQRTWSVSDIVTAAEMNANVRDAVDFLLGKPMFQGFQQSSQSIPNAAFTAVALDSTTVDTYSGHSNTVNNQQYVAQQPGWHKVSGICGFNSNATGTRIAGFAVNSLTTPTWTAALPAGSGAIGVPIPETLVYLNIGDYVAMIVYQTSGGALTLNSGGTYSPRLTVMWDHS